MKTQSAEGKRVPGQGVGYGGKRQGNATFGVVQPQFGQVEIGAQALPAGVDAADTDALANIA